MKPFDFVSEPVSGPPNGILSVETLKSPIMHPRTYQNINIQFLRVSSHINLGLLCVSLALLTKWTLFFVFALKF